MTTTKLPAYGLRTYTMSKNIGGLDFLADVEEKDGDTKTYITYKWYYPGHVCTGCQSKFMHAPGVGGCEMFSLDIASQPSAFPQTPNDARAGAKNPTTSAESSGVEKTKTS